MTMPTPDTEDTALASAGSSRRLRLREFQTQLAERIRAANTQDVARRNQLGVLIGQMHWLLDLSEAGEIVPVGSMTAVPLTQDWFLGVTNIRGNLTTVIDLARFCGGPQTPVDKDCRVVAFSPSLSFNCGLLVSRVMGLRNSQEMAEQTDDASAPWAARRYLDRDSRVWTALDLSLIVQDPRFLQIGL